MPHTKRKYVPTLKSSSYCSSTVPCATVLQNQKKWDWYGKQQILVVI
jgi:hypothetical protein